MDLVEKSFTQKAQYSRSQLPKTSVDKSLNVNTVVIRSSDISGALLKVASKTKADSIVMASHGRGGIKRILLSSETLQVLTHSEIPVPVIRQLFISESRTRYFFHLDRFVSLASITIISCVHHCTITDPI